MPKEYLEDLKKISPKIAKNLNEKIDFQSLLETGVRKLGIMPEDQIPRLSNAIDAYEKAVNETIKGAKRRNALIDIAYIIITVVFVVLAAIFSNIGGIAATTVVSGVTLLSQAKASADTSKAYNRDATKLKVSVTELRAELAICKENDKACLDSVKESIKKAFEALREALKS